jgi:hypothetical protein
MAAGARARMPAWTAAISEKLVICAVVVAESLSLLLALYRSHPCGCWLESRSGLQHEAERPAPGAAPDGAVGGSCSAPIRTLLDITSFGLMPLRLVRCQFDPAGLMGYCSLSAVGVLLAV